TLGIAYYLTNEIDAVLSGSPASKAGLKPGERIQSVQLEIPKELEDDFQPFEKPLALNNEQQAWAFLHQRILQDLPTAVQLVLQVHGSAGSEGEPRHVREVKVGIAQQQGVFTPERGIVFMPMLL